MTSSNSVRSEARRPDIPRLDTLTVRLATARCGYNGLSIHSGIELTTGPLGQGISSAVGLAIAQTHFAAVYNKEGFDVINNYTYGQSGVLAVGSMAVTYVWQYSPVMVA